MGKINIEFEIEEIADVLDHLKECFIEGYINAGDPVLSAIEKLQNAFNKNQEISLELIAEWGGNLNYIASNGTIKNCADELNKLEKEKE